jgi:hypothetical protein
VKQFAHLRHSGSMVGNTRAGKHMGSKLLRTSCPRTSSTCWIARSLYPDRAAAVPARHRGFTRWGAPERFTPSRCLAASSGRHLQIQVSHSHCEAMLHMRGSTRRTRGARILSWPLRAVRLVANGPALPDELLVARDADEIILFAAQGVCIPSRMTPSRTNG